MVRLGKQEYAFGKGDTFWLPAGCLAALSYFPSTQVQTIEVSQRVSDVFPHQAGYIQLTTLLQGLISKLSKVPADSEQAKALLAVIQYELTELKPKLNLTPLSNKLANWQLDSSKIKAETVLVLKVREAEKMRLSGKKVEQIAQKWFDNNDEAYRAISVAVLGNKEK